MNTLNPKITRLSDTEVEIEAEIAADEFEKHWNDVVTYLGKDITIDGFRPGKAPEASQSCPRFGP